MKIVVAMLLLSLALQAQTGTQDLAGLVGGITAVYTDAEMGGLPATRYFVVYTVERERFSIPPSHSRKIEQLQSIGAVREFLENGFVKIVYDGTDCNKCSYEGGYGACTSMYCPNKSPDRPKPRNPKLTGIFKGEPVQFAVEEEVVVIEETIKSYKIAE